MSTLKPFRGAALALFLALPAASAEAQSACATSSLAQYLTTGFTCRIGLWTFSEFGGHAQTDAEGGAQAVVSDPANVQVTPFTSTDALGRLTFGFDLSGLISGAGAHGTTSGFEDAFGWASFGFWLEASAPGTEILDLRVHGSFDGANANPGSLRVGSTYVGSMFGDGPNGGIGSCGTPLAKSTAPGGAPPSVTTTCGTPLTGLVIVHTSTGSTARRFDGSEAPIDGFSTGAITRVELTQGAVSAVPEPSSVVLVAGGLVGMLGIGRARARRRA